MAHGAEVLLVAAVAGYWVLERAETHKRGLKRVGRWLGWSIIAVSLVGVACRVVMIVAGACSGKPFCPFVPKGSVMMERPAPQ